MKVKAYIIRSQLERRPDGTQSATADLLIPVRGWGNDAEVCGMPIPVEMFRQPYNRQVEIEIREVGASVENPATNPANSA